MDEDEQSLDEELPAANVRTRDWVIVGVAYLRSLVEVTHELLTNVEQLLCMRANYKSEQAQFAHEVRMGIESLNGGIQEE